MDSVANAPSITLEICAKVGHASQTPEAKKNNKPKQNKETKTKSKQTKIGVFLFSFCTDYFMAALASYKFCPILNF